MCWFWKTRGDLRRESDVELAFRSGGEKVQPKEHQQERAAGMQNPEWELREERRWCWKAWDLEGGKRRRRGEDPGGMSSEVETSRGTSRREEEGRQAIRKTEGGKGQGAKECGGERWEPRREEG